jgi:hypothetical protein
VPQAQNKNVETSLTVKVWQEETGHTHTHTHTK